MLWVRWKTSVSGWEEKGKKREESKGEQGKEECEKYEEMKREKR